MRKLTWSLLSVFVLSLALALPTFATETSGTDTTSKMKTLPAEMVTCVQTAVETRDTALIASVDKYATDSKAALTARKDALKLAWAIPTQKEMRAALKTAWANYKTALQTARKAMKDSKKAAWDKFKTDRKACKAPSNIDNAGSGVDASL